MIATFTNKKGVIFGTSLLIFSILFTACSFPWSDKDPDVSDAPGNVEHQSGGLFGANSWESQVDIARRRVALRSVIRKWDYYSARNEASRAAEYYETAYKQNANDPQIALRLANAYLELRQFRKAADIFVKFDISQFDEPAKRKVISSIMLDTSRTDRKSAIAGLDITQWTKEYLALLDDCITVPGECIGIIHKSGSADYQIQALRETVKSAEGSSDDTLFVQALLMGKLYEQKAFLAVARLGETILQTRPNYRVVLKMTGYSEYELWNYETAAKILEQYYAFEPKDVEAAYMLGIVNYFRWDYSTSNLYFNSAVLNGYTPKTELERRLVYNYALLGDTPWAFKIFRFLLDENDVLPDDFHIALFMAEQAGEYSKVSLWSRKWLQKFPEDALVNAFAGVASRRKEDIQEAESYLLKAKNLDSKNPLVSLELARLYYQLQKYTEAREHIEAAVAEDVWGYFAEQATALQSLIPPESSWIGPSNTATGSTQETHSSNAEEFTPASVDNTEDENIMHERVPNSPQTYPSDEPNIPPTE